MKVKNKIAVAMSGGVDSSVVAKMMVDEGHEVVGLFLKLWSDPTCNVSKQNRCCDYEALADAREVADKLGIKFYVIDAVQEFKDAIVDEFISEYKKLRTPNPCIKCNEFIKFDLLLKKALEIGAKKLVTGHYARIEDSGNPKSEIRNPKQIINSNDQNKKKLKAGLDPSKDQSYMLYRLNQSQLSKVMFPLGDMLKKDVRKLAVDWDLPVKEKPESQEICFFGDRDYREFLKRYLDKKYFKPGDIVDNKGNVLGEHDGLVNYTIGQRKGIEQVNGKQYTVNSNRSPLYVVGFDVEKNQLVVGEDKEVYGKEMIVSDVNWISGNYKKILASIDYLPEAVATLQAGRLMTKIRYRHDVVPCQIVILNGSEESPEKIKVIFDKPQRAITPGQSAVFYFGDEVLGGGIIEG